MQFRNIVFSVDGGIATITLNTPKNLNAFNETMIEDVSQALSAIEQDESIKVVVINANGKAFSGGGDLVAMLEGIKDSVPVIENTVGPIAEVSYKIKKSTKPVIASVHGAVAGASFNIALACDFCVASEDAKFIQAFVNVGLIPDAGGLFLLSKAVGVNKATQLAMLGTPVTAEQGKELGFVYDVYSLEELELNTIKLAKKLARGPSKSLSLMKQLIFESEFREFKEYLASEVAAQVDCSNTEDFKEGILAFVEKRKPSFTGK